MERNEIMKKLVEELQEKVGDRKVMERTVTKNNGVTLSGISIELEDDPHIAATYYVDKEIDSIIAGDASIDSVVSLILRRDSYAQDAQFVNKDSSLYDKLTDKDFILSNVHRNLVNREMNSDLMDSCPYIVWNDLLIMYRTDISEDQSFRITNEIMDRCGITLEELDIAAKRNDLGEWTFNSMGTIMRRYNPKIGYDAVIDSFMFILSRKNGLYGATCMTDNAFMEYVAKALGEFCIIPSSIHECIAISPVIYRDFDTDTIRKMIGEINSTVLEPTDVLSCMLYKYNNENKTVEVV